jgi:methyl-accepting chemotaxis protein
VIIIVFGIYFSISISRPILQCVDTMKQAARGDFTVRLPSIYGAEIGQLFNACNLLIIYNDEDSANLSRVIGKLRESAQDMLLVSSEMAESSKGLSEQTSVVSATTEEFSAGMTQSSNALATASSHVSSVAASIEEINSTLSTVATAAEETSTMVQEASVLVDSIQNSIMKASDSVKMVSNVFTNVADSVGVMDKSIFIVKENSLNARNKVADADEKAKNTNEIIRRLEIASKQIGKIVNVISDIADQTNMLALNAAIEAAGAGESGKSFMVVANEVKELAKQTSGATSEISDQIENMQINMHDAVTAVLEITTIINGMTEYINSFAHEVSEQRKRSDQITEESAAAAKQMIDISLEINRISENAQSVTQTVVESTRSVNEIARSTSNLVVGTQEIAMNSERASNNMSEINNTSKDMATGLINISKNIQLMSEETNLVQKNAGSTKLSSEELLKIANDLEVMVSKYKIS